MEETAISMMLGRATGRDLNVRGEVGEWDVRRRSGTVTALYNVSAMYVDHLG